MHRLVSYSESAVVYIQPLHLCIVFVWLNVNYIGGGNRRAMIPFKFKASP